VGVEDEVATAGFRRDDAAELRRGIAPGNLDGCDHVVADDRRRIRIDDTAAMVNHDQGAVNADGR